MRYFAKLRQKFIRDHLKKHGYINRADIMDEFDVSICQASLDLAKFRKANRKEISYNFKTKRYEAKK